LHPVTAYIGLGTNLGDRAANLERALRELAGTPGIRMRRTAAVYETAPVGRTDQDWFLNTVAEIETPLAPQALLKELQAIESRLGRVRRERWGPRVIDLDILLYGDRMIDEPGLQVPHPRLTERAFAVVPLAEIAPEVMLPGNLRLADLTRRLAREQQIRIYTPETNLIV
jgi:2-amino-4-hydroxy-6-hydroxymethyldihydropteridine diphosphokinase